MKKVSDRGRRIRFHLDLVESEIPMICVFNETSISVFLTDERHRRGG